MESKYYENFRAARCMGSRTPSRHASERGRSGRRLAESSAALVNLHPIATPPHPHARRHRHIATGDREGRLPELTYTMPELDVMYCRRRATRREEHTDTD